jgi:DNA-binding response OmpR family regulator
MKSEHSPHSESNGCVIVVDDRDDLRQMLCLALETGGFDVIEADTQLELQRRLAHCQPDAVVLDLQRSEADGLALLTRMRARQKLNTVPIVFLSGCDADDFRYDAMCAGADWFGVRPVGILELQHRVGELIRNGRPAANQDDIKPRRPLRILRLKPTG